MIAWSTFHEYVVCRVTQGYNSTKDWVFNLQDLAVGHQSFFVKKHLLLITIGELYWILVIRMKWWVLQQYMLCYLSLMRVKTITKNKNWCFFTPMEKYTLLEYIESSANKGN